MKQKIEWIGPEGFNPHVGLVSRGDQVCVAPSVARFLIEQGVAQAIVKKKKSEG